MQDDTKKTIHINSINITTHDFMHVQQHELHFDRKTKQTIQIKKHITYIT